MAVKFIYAGREFEVTTDEAKKIVGVFADEAGYQNVETTEGRLTIVIGQHIPMALLYENADPRPVTVARRIR